jgi:3-deoxy-D-manno-octulosonic-acid transferase
MIFHLYNILLTFLLILTSPVFLFRGLIDRRFRKELTQRTGFFPRPPFKGPIWIHAASVGEVFCAVPLLKKIKSEFPRSKVVLTTMTRTGNERAKTIPEADLVLFLPVDHPWVIRRALQRIEPALLFLAETEIWPNLLRSLGRRKVPILLFNGRISEESFRRYLPFKFFFSRCLSYVTRFFMQTEEDRDRIARIGAPFERTRVTGNIKFDHAAPSLDQASAGTLASSIGLREKEKVIIAGSTHPGEEEILLQSFKDLKKAEPDLLLILAPRHLERLEEVERTLRKAPVFYRRRSSLCGKEEGRPEVILLDTMGELMGLYSLGTLCFIGGSLVPVGGHNPIEPLLFRKCVLFGPHMFHFAEISRGLVDAGGAVQVKGAEDLALQLRHLLSDEGARNEVGEKGYQFLQRHRGAVERIFQEIKPFLGNPS